MTDEERFNQHLPLNPRSFMVLLGLAEGRAHGYEIKKRAEERSQGKVSLDVGSLYRTLASFLDQGLIQEVAAHPDATDEDARRRYYELTGLGRGVLTAEVNRLAGLVEFARGQALAESPGGTS